MVRRLGIQVVLYENPVSSQQRLAGAIGATVACARSAGAVGQVELRYGDCGPAPVLTDDDVERLREVSALDVTSAFFDANLGSAGGSNALAAARVEELTWVLNPDTYPAPTCLTELLAALDADPAVAAVDGRQIPIEHPKAHDPASGDTSWASGACMLLRRSAFDAVGGFDDHFFPLYCDDVDLSWRLRLAGWSVRHAPRAVVFHDKEIGADGGLGWSAVAARSSLLARLWLYHRYGRADLATHLLEQVDPSDEIGTGVVAEYAQRVADGDVPPALDGSERVAQFVGRTFGGHRFAYGSGR